MKIKLLSFIFLITLVFFGCIQEEDTIVTYSVRYNANGGTGTMADTEHTYDTASYLRTNSFTRAGHLFIEWNTEADGSGTSYSDGESVLNLSSTRGATVNLFAQWLINVTIPTNGGVIRNEILYLTVGDRRDLNEFLPNNMTDRTITWQSSNSTLVSINNDGIALAQGIDTNMNSNFTSSPGTGTATITATASNTATTHTIQVRATTEALINIMSLPPLWTYFADYFLIGNISRGSDLSGTGANASITDERLTHHFNAITAENHMKPDALSNGRTGNTISFTWTNADRFVDAANNAGMAVIGHTLLWHSQNPNWIWSQVASRTGTSIASKEQALTIMRQYINAVAGRYAGRIHTWDVLNEVFPDNASSPANATAWRNSMRRGASGEGQDANPWYIAIGYEFVFEGFLAARHADPNAILYYNDYNTDNTTRARLIRDMVLEVNNQYLALPSNQKPAGERPGRLLIEGIGMQEHHNTNVTAAQIRATIDLFRAMSFTGSSEKIRLSVSELDILGQGWNDFGGSGTGHHTSSTVTNQGLLTQARLYGEYMTLYLQNSDLIERVSIWGISDNHSWRSRGLPLLFDHGGRAKPAYYRFVGALSN